MEKSIKHASPGKRERDDGRICVGQGEKERVTIEGIREREGKGGVKLLFDESRLMEFVLPNPFFLSHRGF